MRSGSNVQVTGLVMEIHPRPCCFHSRLVRVYTVLPVSFYRSLFVLPVDIQRVLNRTHRRSSKSKSNQRKMPAWIKWHEQIHENIDRRSDEFQPSDTPSHSSDAFWTECDCDWFWWRTESEPAVRLGIHTYSDCEKYCHVILIF